MKLAILAPENSPSWGGVGAYNYNLINNLPETVEIHVITLNRKSEDPYEKIIEKDIFYHKILSVNERDIVFSNLKFQFSILKNLKKLNSKYKFDVIHSHSGHLPHFFAQFQKIDSKIVLTPHGETKGLVKVWNKSGYKNNTELLNTIFSPIIELEEKISFKKAERIFPVSHFTLNQIEKLYNIKIEKKSKVVYNGVDTNIFQNENNNKSDIVITFIGRFYAIKGVNIFLEAIKKVLKKGYKIKVLLVGRGDTNYLNKFLSGIPKHVYSIVGKVNYSEMKDIYNNSDIIVVPSLYEACPSTVLESMSCERVCIASNVGGIPEIIENGYNGILFNTNDSGHLANEIIQILEETVDTDKIRKNARKTVMNRFNWNQLSKKLYNEYLDVLEV